MKHPPAMARQKPSTNAKNTLTVASTVCQTDRDAGEKRSKLMGPSSHGTQRLPVAKGVSQVQEPTLSRSTQTESPLNPGRG